MISRLKSAFIAALVAAPVLFSSPLAHSAPEGTPKYKTPEEAQTQLDSLCATFQLLKRTGQRGCVQETYGQSYSFAENFFNALKLTPDNYADKKEEWADKLNDEDYVALVGYGRTCNMLLDVVINPESVLQYEPGTVLGLPRYCVGKASDLAKKLGIDIDFKEAGRMTGHLDKLGQFYKAHPVIPQKKPGEDRPVRTYDA